MMAATESESNETTAKATEGPEEENEEAVDLVLEAATGEHRIPKHANFVNVAHSPYDFVLTFGYIEVSNTEGDREDRRRIRNVSRVGLPPNLVLVLAQALVDNLGKYTKSYPGQIPSLDELFADYDPEAEPDEPSAENSESKSTESSS